MDEPAFLSSNVGRQERRFAFEEVGVLINDFGKSIMIV